MDTEEMRKIMLDEPKIKKDDIKSEKLAGIMMHSEKKSHHGRIYETQKPAETGAKKEESTDDIIKKTLMRNMENYLNDVNDSCSIKNTQTEELLRMITEQMIDMQAVKHFVGIQPMSGPVGLAYSLQYTPEVQEVTDEEIPRHMSLNILSHVLEARTRKLATELGFEEVQQNNFRGAPETGVALAQEIYEEIKNDISIIAHKETFDVTEKINSLSEVSQTEITILAIYINKCANDIARRTRRGAGNFIIVSETVAEILMRSNHFVVTSSNEYNYGYVTYLGILNGAIKVYCDFNIEYNKTIVGYKGAGETDVGYIYAPYVPLMSPGVVVNATTFQPLIKFMTRYGKYINRTTIENTSTDGSETVISREPCDYYVELTFDNLPKLSEIKFKEVESKETDAKETITDSFDAAMEVVD